MCFFNLKSSWMSESALSSSFEYLCLFYVMGIWSLKIFSYSARIDLKRQNLTSTYRRQILTSKVGPRAVVDTVSYSASNVVSMSGQRRRRCTSIVPALRPCLVFAVYKSNRAVDPWSTRTRHSAAITIKLCYHFFRGTLFFCLRFIKYNLFLSVFALRAAKP